RTAGAATVATAYILLNHPDKQPTRSSIIRRTIDLAQRKNLHCVTTNIICRGGGTMDNLLYFGNNLFQYLSLIHHPFSTGMFMLFDKRRFDELGGFHEQVHFAEDYLLSKQVARSKFAIMMGCI